jgi:hypothetical protein
MPTAAVESRMHNPLQMFPDAFKRIRAIHEPARADGPSGNQGRRRLT